MIANEYKLSGYYGISTKYFLAYEHMRGNYIEPFWQIYRNLSGNRVRGRWTHTNDYRDYYDDYRDYHDDDHDYHDYCGYTYLAPQEGARKISGDLP